jgi:hypothetical protein
VPDPSDTPEPVTADSVSTAPLPPPVQVAQAPVSTRSAIYFPPSPAPFQNATPAPAPSLAPTPPPRASFANAAAPAAASGAWSVQLGAFGSPDQARHTAEAARRAAPDLLASAVTQTPPTSPFGGHRLYRARLSGLSHDTAINSCARLGGLLPCIPVPPGGA